MVIDGSKFFTKILSVVDWSSLFLNFSQDLPGTVFEVSATALCVHIDFADCTYQFMNHYVIAVLKFELDLVFYSNNLLIAYSLRSTLKNKLLPKTVLSLKR